MKNIISAFTTLVLLSALCIWCSRIIDCISTDGSGKGIQSGCDNRDRKQ